MSQYFIIIDETKRIAECEVKDIPTDLKQNIIESLGQDSDLEYLTFFYDFNEDYIVINQEHDLHDLFKALVADMVEMDLDKVSDLYDLAPKSVKNTIKTLYNIMLERKERV